MTDAEKNVYSDDRRNPDVHIVFDTGDDPVSYSVHHVTDAPFVPRTDHSSSLGIIIVTDGVAQAEFSLSSAELEKGDILLFPTDKPSLCRITPLQVSEFELFVFPLHITQNVEINTSLDRLLNDSSYIVKSDANIEMFDSLSHIKSEITSSGTYRAALIKAYLCIFLVSFIKSADLVRERVERECEYRVFESNTIEGFPAAVNSHAATIARITELIRRGITGEISIDSLAAEAHMSRSNFFRVFRKHTGMSVNDYILKCRIEKTLELLRLEDCNILDAAYASGFTSSSGFYKSFRKALGTSPKEYIKASRHFKSEK